jgi:hypothetical protein
LRSSCHALRLLLTTRDTRKGRPKSSYGCCGSDHQQPFVRSKTYTRTTQIPQIHIRKNIHTQYTNTHTAKSHAKPLTQSENTKYTQIHTNTHRGASFGAIGRRLRCFAPTVVELAAFSLPTSQRTKDLGHRSNCSWTSSPKRHPRPLKTRREQRVVIE